MASNLYSIETFNFNTDFTIPTITEADKKKQSNYAMFSFFLNNKNGNPYQFKLPRIKLTQGGIIPFTDKTSSFFASNDDPKRFSIQIPFDDDQPDCTKLLEFFKKLDEFFGSETFQTKFLKQLYRSAKNFQYNNAIHEASCNEDGTYKNPLASMDTVKIKFDVRKSVKPYQILTNVYCVESGTNNVIEIDASTFNNIEKNINRNAEISGVFRISRIYASKLNNPNGIMRYGVHIVFDQVIIHNRGQPKVTGKKPFIPMDGLTFIPKVISSDDTDESIVSQTPRNKEATRKSTVKAPQTINAEIAQIIGRKSTGAVIIDEEPPHDYDEESDDDIQDEEDDD